MSFTRNKKMTEKEFENTRCKLLMREKRNTQKPLNTMSKQERIVLFYIKEVERLKELKEKILKEF